MEHTKVWKASVLCAVAALSAWLGCSHGSSSGGGGAGGTVTADCPVEQYVDGGDPGCAEGGTMREIPLPEGGTMCIDKTEVTVGEYQAFLASGAKPSLPQSDPAYARCAAKQTFAPGCSTEPCQGTSCALPQNCVDQCDAKLFCVWAGKRLCGPIGSTPLALADVNDPTMNQWMNACAGAGGTWPYGSTYESQACNTVDHQPAPCGGPAVTASFPGCQAPAGPYNQVFDLSGNVSEWVDSSQEGDTWPNQRCVIMGGSYVHYLGDVSCAGATLQWPCDSLNPEFGFRCCSQ